MHPVDHLAEAAPGITLHPRHEELAEEVWAALGPVGYWSEGQGRGFAGPDESPGTEADRYRRCRVLRDRDGAVAGMVAARDGGFRHPHYLWSHVEIAPGHRERGLGGAAWSALRRLTAEDGRDHKAKAARGSVAHRFMQRHGFSEIQRNRIIAIDLDALQPAPAERGFTVQAYPGGHGAPDDLIGAYAAWYRASHWWNPVPPTTPEQHRAHFHGLPTRCVLSARRPDGTPVGYLYVDDPEDDLAGAGTYVEGGPLDPLDPEGAAITRALLAAARPFTDGPRAHAEVDDAARGSLAALTGIATGVLPDTVIAATGPVPVDPSTGRAYRAD